MVPTSAGGGREEAEQEWCQGGGYDELEGGGSGQGIRRVQTGSGDQEHGRKEWFRHKMSRKQLLGITGQKVQAGGGRGVLVEG